MCDGVQDCWNGHDELNCQLPQSCSSWWSAGYHNNGVYYIGETRQWVKRNGFVVKFYLLSNVFGLHLIMLCVTYVQDIDTLHGLC